MRQILLVGVLLTASNGNAADEREGTFALQQLDIDISFLHQDGVDRPRLMVEALGEPTSVRTRTGASLGGTGDVDVSR